MFCQYRLPRHIATSPEHELRCSRGHSNAGQLRAANRGGNSRSGRAITEIVLIILVPGLCLIGWALFDNDLKNSLLAAPHSDTALAFNPVYDIVPIEPGVFVSMHSQGQLRFWDKAQTSGMGDIQSHLPEVRCGTYSAEQRLLAVGSAMGQIEVWDLDNLDHPVQSTTHEKTEVMSCAFTPDGSLLISGDDEGRISIWEPRTLNRLHKLAAADTTDAIRVIVVSDDGRLLLAGTRVGTVHVWDLQERKLVRIVRASRTSICPDSCIEFLALLPGNREFLAATHEEGVAVWNLETGVCVRRFADPHLEVRSGAISADRSSFFAGGKRGQVHEWDIATGQHVNSIQQGDSTVRSLGCDLEGLGVACGNWDGRVHWHTSRS